jgi:hypothetical protein
VAKAVSSNPTLDGKTSYSAGLQPPSIPVATASAESMVQTHTASDQIPASRDSAASAVAGGEEVGAGATMAAVPGRLVHTHMPASQHAIPAASSPQGTRIEGGMVRDQPFDEVECPRRNRVEFFPDPIGIAAVRRVL